VFGDTQYGNAYSCPENCAAFLRLAKDRGCEVAFHTGDVLDGWKVYKGQEFELRDVGFEAQLDRFEAEAPRGLRVKFITGNHDASFKNLAGISVGAAISKRRPDWEFIGEDQGLVELRTAGGAKYTVGLYHMGGGTSGVLRTLPQGRVHSGVSQRGDPAIWMLRVANAVYAENSNGRACRRVDSRGPAWRQLQHRQGRVRRVLPRAREVISFFLDRCQQWATMPIAGV
jgi:hypothetical protein